MSKFYYHGVDDLLTILKIIDCGYIKSKRLLGYGKENDFNGLDYISLCNKGEDYMYEENKLNSYENYIKNSFCFIISDKINAIKCNYIDIYNCDESQINGNSDERYSDMFDEWQIKDKISLNDIIGIGLPLNYLNKMKNYYSSLDYQLERIYLLASMLNLDIVNTDEENFIEKYESKKAIKDGVDFDDITNNSCNRKNKKKALK